MRPELPILPDVVSPTKPQSWAHAQQPSITNGSGMCLCVCVCVCVCIHTHMHIHIYMVQVDLEDLSQLHE